MIKHESILELQEHIKIEEVVQGAGVVLKKRGANYLGEGGKGLIHADCFSLRAFAGRAAVLSGSGAFAEKRRANEKRRRTSRAKNYCSAENPNGTNSDPDSGAGKLSVE